MTTYRIIARTSIRMDGTRDIIGLEAETFDNWTAATCRAMELEYEARGRLHNGRAIQYDAIKED